MDVPLLGQDHSKPAPKPEAGSPPEATSVRTAFLAYLDPAGQWTITPDINVPVKPERAASPDEMVSCAAIIQMDMTAQKAGQATVQYQMMQAQAIASKQAEMRLQQELANSR